MVVSKARLAAKSVWGQGGCLPLEVAERPFPGASLSTGYRILSEDDASASLNWLAGYRLDSGKDETPFADADGHDRPR